jgi:hypothetical protein
MTESEAFTYDALPLQQQPDAPVMYLTTTTAAELLQWADVPNAKADYMAGYQRVYNPDRAREIGDFLGQDPKNIIPGAIIVTAAESAVTVSPSACPPAVRVTITLQELSFKERLATVLDHFIERLSEEERVSIPILDSEDGADDEDNDSPEAEEESGVPESYIAVLTAELRSARDDLASLPKARQDAIHRYIESVSKPGLIIDGQHRVYGAKDVSKHDVVLPLIVLPGLTTAEQVFHFYVLNNKAKPLTPTELRRTVSTSLTNLEIDQLWQRFEKAGLNPEQARWSHKMNTEPQSPFRGLIDFGFEEGFIRENVAYTLISKFVKMPRKYRSLYEGIPAWQTKTDLDQRLPYFYAFWRAIGERYQELWNNGIAVGGASGGAQLFYKSAMLVLQEYVLDTLLQVMNVRKMEGKPSPLADADDLKTVVKALLVDLPAEFFSREWQRKQIDTSDGRAFLRAQMNEVIQNQGRHLGNRALFKKS